MSPASDDVVALNVRVPRTVMGLLDTRVEQERRANRRVTKEKLVADAIQARFAPSTDEWLPTHEATLAPIDHLSNAALLDLLDELEARQ